MKKLPDSKRATVNLKGKPCRKKTPQQQHASEYTEEEPAAISEHGDGLNETTATVDKRRVEAANKEYTQKCDETTAAEDKVRNEATEAKMMSSKEVVLKSQNIEICKSEEDEEIMALNDERKKIKKDDKEER